MADLHIFNGDCTLALWQKCGFSASTLVWRETYLEGPLPDTDDLHLFRLARAEYLATFEELRHINSEQLYLHLQKMDDTLLILTAADELMLWFDACIFDQTMLMRILYLLDNKRSGLPVIFLYCCDGNILQTNDFMLAETQKIRLNDQDLQLAARAWQLFIRRDAAGLRELSCHGNFEHLKQMQNALLRCAEEIPDTEGLTRTGRQILQLLEHGSLSFQEIFNGLKKFENLPFLGDTACRRILNDLIRQGRLHYRNNSYQMV